MANERFQDRMRRLRREAPATSSQSGSSPAEPPAAGVPGWLREHLTRKRERMAAPAEQFHGTLWPLAREAPSELLEVENDAGVYALRRQEFATDSHHGEWRLDEIDAGDPATVARLCGDDALADVDLRRAVFLDTETTGLSGGAGVFVYMVGLGYFEADRFVVWQGFMRDPSEEKALLHDCARLIAERDGLVSFFGKSFDRHRLEDKMKIAGVAPPFRGKPHLDLYHPLRRLTKGAYADGRLATMESRLNALVRVDDLPGSLAPAAWFDFLAGRPHRLEGVFKHNLLDVLSLVTLSAYLGRVEEEERTGGEPLAGHEALRAKAIAASYLSAGERTAALPWLARGLERCNEEGELHDELHMLFAETARHLKLWSEARPAYEVLLSPVRRSRLHVPAALGLLKLLEHGAKSLDEAHSLCEATLRHCRTDTWLARYEPELKKRLARLNKKRGASEE